MFLTNLKKYYLLSILIILTFSGTAFTAESKSNVGKVYDHCVVTDDNAIVDFVALISIGAKINEEMFSFPVYLNLQYNTRFGLSLGVTGMYGIVSIPSPLVDNMDSFGSIMYYWSIEGEFDFAIHETTYNDEKARTHLGNDTFYSPGVKTTVIYFTPHDAQKRRTINIHGGAIYESWTREENSIETKVREINPFIGVSLMIFRNTEITMIKNEETKESIRRFGRKHKQVEMQKFYLDFMTNKDDFKKIGFRIGYRIYQDYEWLSYLEVGKYPISGWGIHLGAGYAFDFGPSRKFKGEILDSKKDTPKIDI